MTVGVVRSTGLLIYSALLVSVFFHLVLLNAAVELTVRWKIFSRAAAEEFFRVKPMELPETEPREFDETLWKEELAPTEVQAAAERAEDIRALLARKGFVALDATEEEINEAIRAMLSKEEVPKEVDLGREGESERSILQEVIAIDRERFPDRVELHKRSVADVPRGYSGSDVIAEGSVADARRALEGAAGGAGAEDGGQGIRMAGGGEIPGIGRPAGAEPERGVETIDVVDVVAEDVEGIRKFPSLDDLLTIEMRTYHEPGNLKGFFVVSIRPKKDRSHFDVIAKDIIFVVDSSSSILQPKLNRYVEGVQSGVDRLNEGDRFSVVVFSVAPKRFSEGLVEVTAENQRLAKRFITGLEAQGRTDVYAALEGLVRKRPAPERPYILFLVTDGRPTAGIIENRRIINQVAEINEDKAAIYAFAGGGGVNEYLLDLLAYRNRGASRFERRFEQIEESLAAFCEEVKDPILINLRCSLGSIDRAEVYPKVLPDFFLKSQVLITGRFEREPEFAMQLLGEVNAVTKEFIFRQEFPAKDTGDASVARLWAFQKIYHLIGRVVQEGETPELIGQIRNLGTRYKIKSPYYQ